MLPWPQLRGKWLTRGSDGAPDLETVVITLCSACLDGKGDECHTPGCALVWCAVPAKSLRDYTNDGPLGPLTSEENDNG